MVQTDILSELRSRTKPLHDDLEQQVGKVDPFRHHAHYVRLLKAFHGFYVPAERVLPAYGENASEWLDGDRRKVPALRADLFACRVEADDTVQVPLCVDRAWETTAGVSTDRHHVWQLGCMYVLEGATLGGQYLLRQWRNAGKGQSLMPPGTRFFQGYGDDTGAMWSRFRSHLTAAARDRDAIDAMCGAAEQMFLCMRRWIAEARP
jgi:heme oxygenase